MIEHITLHFIFESLQQRRWYRKICCLFEIINHQLARYLFELVPSPNTRFFCHNPNGIKLLTRLLLGLSHPRENKFRHSLQDCVNSRSNASYILILNSTIEYIKSTQRFEGSILTSVL